MATFIEYELDDGQTILIRLPEEAHEALIEASSDASGNVIVKTGRKLSDALKNIKAQAVALRAQLSDLEADEVTVKFSLTTTGEAGIFAIGKLGLETNYEVSLKWQRPDSAK